MNKRRSGLCSYDSLKAEEEASLLALFSLAARNSLTRQ